MSETPLVSVLMTAYNRERYIAEAIESVLTSTFNDFELIIVDDASTDKTVSIAKSFAAKDGRVKVFVNDKNLGDYPNRNHAASLAKGEYMFYVDSDDTVLPHGIESLLKTMELFPDANFGIYSAINSEPFELKSKEAVDRHFFKTPFLIMGPGGTIQRLSFFRKIGGYPEKYGPANDMYYNLKATCSSSIVILPFEFMRYRRHEGQQINNTKNYLYNNYKYMKDALSELGLPLESEKIRWLQKKNKRRFLTNVVKDFFKTWNAKRTMDVIKNADYSIRDAFQAVFHL